MEPVFANTVSHWWDGSEVYGSDAEPMPRQLREGAQAAARRPTATCRRTSRASSSPASTRAGGSGSAACTRCSPASTTCSATSCARTTRGWSDERVYQTARLIVSALIAKIHTVEWTPAILGTARHRHRAEGQLERPAGQRLADAARRLADRRPRRRSASRRRMPDHHGAPYSLTEDFVTVYRLHPLLPDEYLFVDHRTGELLGERTLPRHPGRDDRRRDARARPARTRSTRSASRTPARSRCTTTRASLRALRARRRGRSTSRSSTSCAPAAAACRATTTSASGLHKPRMTRWEELCTDDPESVRRLREVYRSVDEVDTMVGLFAETPPAGLRLLRHGVPHLHPDGVAPAAERPLPDRRLPARGLHAVRHGLGRATTA